METQKIVNLLNEFSKFATIKWYIINDQNNGQYGRGNGSDCTLKFETKVITSNLCDYSDTYIILTGDINVKNFAANTNVAFKNCVVTHLEVYISLKEMNLQ